MKLPPVLALGKLALKSCYLLSPLEGVSCVGFRQLCHRNGAGLTFTEMVRSQGILRNNVATLELIDTYDPETPTGLQLLAKSAKELASTLERLGSLSEEPKYAHFKNICAVDINLGCPSPDIIREGAGPALPRCTNCTVLYDWNCINPWKMEPMIIRRGITLFKVLKRWKPHNSSSTRPSHGVQLSNPSYCRFPGHSCRHRGLCHRVHA
jgi:hypothetical protein